MPTLWDFSRDCRTATLPRWRQVARAEAPPRARGRRGLGGKGISRGKKTADKKRQPSEPKLKLNPKGTSNLLESQTGGKIKLDEGSLSICEAIT